MEHLHSFLTTSLPIFQSVCFLNYCFTVVSLLSIQIIIIYEIIIPSYKYHFPNSKLLRMCACWFLSVKVIDFLDSIKPVIEKQLLPWMKFKDKFPLFSNFIDDKTKVLRKCMISLKYFSKLIQLVNSKIKTKTKFLDYNPGFFPSYCSAKFSCLVGLCPILYVCRQFECSLWRSLPSLPSDTISYLIME